MRIPEDTVKHDVAAASEAAGSTVDVRWTRDRGIDLDAHRDSKRPTAVSPVPGRCLVKIIGM
jgi:hypothetical protein